jgi:hypothetical protein
MSNNLPNIIALVIGLVFLAACGTQAKRPVAEVAAPAPVSKIIVGQDDVNGQIIGDIARSHRFARLQIGMTRSEVEQLVGRPTDITAQSLGTAWVPYYFGSDTWHTESYYRGEGRLVFDTNSHLVLIDVSENARK